MEEQGSGAGAVLGIIGLLIYAAIIVFMIAGVWKVFVKAGQPGWASLIPFYNMYVLLQIVGRPGWWLILFFIPFVNFVVIFLVAIDLAKAFGKGTGFGIGLVLLCPIFYPMLGYGSASYQGAPTTA